MDIFSQLFWIRRMGGVRRFHGIHLTHEETVFHHSASVAMIVIQCVENPSADLLKACLIHDLTELVTGDVPAPVKWFMGQEFRENWATLDAQILKYFQIRSPGLTKTDYEILKAADVLDGVFTCLMNKLKGNFEVDWPFENYRQYIESTNPFSNLPMDFKNLWTCILNAYRSESSDLVQRAENYNFWESLETVPR